MFRTIAVAFAALLLVSSVVDAGITKGRINETGQTTSFGAGSVGDLERGLTRSFVDLGNGTIKDQRTGLLWEKKSDDGGIHDKDNTYTWGQELSPYAMNGTMTSFVATLNLNCFAGFCDWRIPNRRELESLVNLGAYTPAAFTPFNTGCAGGCTVATCSCTGVGGYWSSSTNLSLPGTAWYLDFGNGYASTDFKGAAYRVRAVRGGF